MNRESEYGLLLLLGLVCVAFGINSLFFSDTGNASHRLQKPEAVGGRKSSFPPVSAQVRAPQSATNAVHRALALSPSLWANEAVEHSETIDESLLLNEITIPAELAAMADQLTDSEVWSGEDQLTALEREMEREVLQQEMNETQLAEDIDPALPDAATIPADLLVLVNEPDAPE